MAEIEYAQQPPLVFLTQNNELFRCELQLAALVCRRPDFAANQTELGALLPASRDRASAARQCDVPAAHRRTLRRTESRQHNLTDHAISAQAAHCTLPTG